MVEPPTVVATLQQLIRIPSVNPMGRDETDPPYLERRLTDYLQQFFEGLGVPWHRQQVAPGRDNIVAHVAGRHGAGMLVFEVHQDTVPVDGMTIAPWEPVVRDGRLYGRGACDDKGPMASMLTAFARIARQRPPHASSLVMACTVNEEHGFTGASKLTRLWSQGADPLLARLPDAVIVAEPTSLDVVVAHKGVVRWRCHATGRAAHSSYPDQGENAIYHMGHVITACQRYATRLATEPSHPLVGAPTINLGTIQGGICVNAVPDQCTIEFDRRLLPHEEPLAAREAAIVHLAQTLPDATRGKIVHDEPFLTSPGLSDEGTGPLAAQVAQVARQVGVTGRRLGVPYATDAPFFARLGIPTVIFGPGSIEQAHTANEWICVRQLQQAAEAYYLLAAEGMNMVAQV